MQLETMPGDSFDHGDQQEWGEVTNCYVLPDTLCWKAPCDCRFTMPADGFHMEWTPCEPHRGE